MASYLDPALLGTEQMNILVHDQPRADHGPVYRQKDVGVEALGVDREYQDVRVLFREQALTLHDVLDGLARHVDLDDPLFNVRDPLLVLQNVIPRQAGDLQPYGGRVVGWQGTEATG